ncbi:MAG: HNH endonuclease [Actinobacteria bacterium]|nr:HNH endonuclease [Actinomycetota bacterium]
MTRPHPSATGSYGEQACAWIESTQRITLRWWQRLAITRQLEHDEAGRLVWRVVVESAPRRAGKSVRLRGVALWRLEHGAALFGEPQLVMHCGKDVAIVREIQRAAWRWAEDVAGWTVTKGNGKEALETPNGDRWLARAMHSVYGYDVSLGMVDEGWGVDPAAVDEGMEPATLERPSPQLHLTSTAHRQATSLMRRRISAALSGADPDTLLLLWAAAPGADAGDPETWRAASPHWTEARGRMIATKYAAALAGEVDPEADDLDPMAGFEAQYLNRWQLRPVLALAGSPVVDEQDWRALAVVPPARPPDAVAVEGWPGEGVAVARAWRVGERAVVSVADALDAPEAAALVAGYRCRRRPVVGASLAEDPVWARRATPETGPVRSSVAELSGLLRDDAVRHDGGDFLTEQVLGLRTTPGADGPRMRSTGRADAVKAVVWAARSARVARRGPQRILLPSAV